MRKVLVTVALSIMCSATAFANNINYSGIAESVCKDNEKKEACMSVVNATISSAFEHGSAYGVCHLMEQFGEPIKGDKKAMCDSSEVARKEINELSY